MGNGAFTHEQDVFFVFFGGFFRGRELLREHFHGLSSLNLQAKGAADGPKELRSIKKYEWSLGPTSQ
jgi:hypothetical protein